MRSATTLLGAALAGAALAACQGPPPPSGPPAVAHDTDPLAEAHGAMRRHDWTTAAALLQAALARTPDSLAVHYRLAIAYSHLNARADALREFAWVLAHAPAGSEEARVARAWVAAARGGSAPATAADAPGDPQRGSATLTGSVTMRDPAGQLRPQGRQVVLLVGVDGTPTHGLRYKRRTDQDGRYEFANVVPGPYDVTGAIAGAATWRQRVVLELGQKTVIDLTSDAAVLERTVRPDGARPTTAPPARALRAADARENVGGPTPHPYTAFTEDE